MQNSIVTVLAQKINDVTLLVEGDVVLTVLPNKYNMGIEGYWNLLFANNKFEVINFIARL